MSLRKPILALLTFGFAFANLNAAMPDSERIYEFSLQLTGKIGGKYAIDMVLDAEKSESVPFMAKSGECLELSGWYAYHSQIKPIYLEGKFCPQNGGVILSVGDVQDEKERFTGKWSSAAGTFVGDWHMNSNNKTLPFELKLIPVSDKAKAAFLADIKKEYQGEEAPMESFVLRDIGMDAKGCYLDGLQYGWNGYLERFCGTRLEIITDYSSTYRSTSYRLNYQVLPGASGCVLAWFIDSNYIKEEEEEDESSEGYSLEVLCNAGSGDLFPSGFPSSKSFSGDSEESNYRLHVLHDRLSLEVDGKVWKLVWDGNRFVEAN
jgi:hypothetical protein